MPADFYGVARNVISRLEAKKSRKVAFQFWRHFASAAYKTAYKFSYSVKRFTRRKNFVVTLPFYRSFRLLWCPKHKREVLSEKKLKKVELHFWRHFRSAAYKDARIQVNSVKNFRQLVQTYIDVVNTNYQFFGIDD